MIHLRRADLAKQFEGIVLQEIKNHNDAVLATNVSINEIKQTLDVLSKDLAKSIARQENQLHNFEVEINQLKDDINDIMIGQQAKIDGVVSKFKNFHSSFGKDLCCVQEKCIGKEAFFESVAEWGQNLKDLRKDFDEQQNSLFNKLCDVRRDFERELENRISGVLSLPDKLPGVKAELEKKIECASVDCAGVLKVLQTYKKDVFIIEKKLENIYTLISRLKEKVES